MGLAFEKPRRLEDDEKIQHFHCGVDIVDAWATDRAHLARKRGTAVVYVSRCGENVAGFYSLSSHSITRSEVTGGALKRNTPAQIPVILMGMLGVDVRFKGRGLGAMLLHDAITMALTVSSAIGAKALVVDLAGEEAIGFYSHYGFKPVPGSSKLFISLGV